MIIKYWHLKHFMNFHKKNIHRISYFHVRQTDMTGSETKLKEYISSCIQNANTSENHCYTPLNCNTMRMFQVSGANTFFDICLRWHHAVQLCCLQILWKGVSKCCDGRKWLQ
jgi:hypothetical protein